jgi:proline iminopeptidase
MHTIKTGMAIIGLGLVIAGCEILDPDEPGNLVPKTVDEDPTLPSIEVNGTKLHAQTFGDPENPVIIFIHGGPGDDHASLLRLAQLQDDYFLVFYDQRSAGLSRRHDPEDISVGRYIGDLDAIIEKYRRSPDDKVNLVCHSWGAQIATFYIDDDPQHAMQQIDKAVFSDPGPWKDEWMHYVLPDLSVDLEWLNELVWANDFISPDTHERADYFGFVTGKSSNPDRHLSKTDPSPKWRWGAVATIKLRDVDGADGWDWTENLSEYTGEVLFVRSGLNEDHTPEYFELAMEPYPNTDLVTIEDVGHDMAWVKADEYAAHVREFLSE